MKKILITGGAGFIASHLVEHFVRNTDWEIVIIDKLTYASLGLSRLKDSQMLGHSRVSLFVFDLAQPFSEGVKTELGEIHIIIHLAAESHVDHSIAHPPSFIQNNVMSTVYLLEYARTCSSLEKFIYFSTDEVYGPALGNTQYKETDRHNPTNPYSASKSAGEMICLAYQNTFQIPLVMVNVMNAFGERQHVEKFIPKCVQHLLTGEKLWVHADKNGNSGSRFYIHARNIASAVLFLIHHGKVGELYHITGEKEVSNLDLFLMIQSILKECVDPLPEIEYELIDFHSTRPGHDLRYALCGDKLKDLGWSPPITFEKSLRKTIEWTLEHKEWLKK